MLSTLLRRRSGGFSLPYSIDFSTYGDGALPSHWTGSTTMAISSGQVVNTPALGSELITNGNMETGDPPSSYLAFADAVLSSAADERTGGAGAASMDVARDGNNNPFAYQTFTAAQWSYGRLTGWGKIVDGTYLDLFISGGSFGNVWRQGQSAWFQWVKDEIILGATPYVQLHNLIVVDTNSNRFDDVSYRTYTTPAQLFMGVDGGNSLVTVKADITGTQTQGGIGVLACVDDFSNPQNYVLATLTGGGFNTTEYVIHLFKNVGGTVTNVIAGTSVVYSAGAALEIRHTATNTFQVFYNGAQVSTDKTISDAGIVDNTKHGLFMGETGASSGVDAFFLEAT